MSEEYDNIDNIEYNYENDYYPDDYDQNTKVLDSNDDKLNLQKNHSNLGKEEEAKILMEKVIEEVIELTCLSRDNVIILLLQNNWNKDKIDSYWWENTNKHLIKHGMEFDQNLKFNKNSTSKECMVCFSNSKNLNYISLSCNHLFCTNCWTEYLEYKAQDIYSCTSATCMLKNCNVCVPPSLFTKYLSEHSLKLYNNSLVKNFTENNDDIKWCPSNTCGRFVKSKDHVARDITCGCKTVFCFKCRRDGHRPCTCMLMEIWDKKNNSEGENVLWLQANTKQCPSCNKYIEKNQGCNHMTCRKNVGGCGYEFCWICMGEWKPHGSEWYNCNKYDPKAEKNIKKEKDINKLKGELEKFAHYFGRYFNHQKSMKISIKLRETIEAKKQNFFFNRKMNLQELTFLNEALEVVIKCHRVLTHTYIFGYYMNENAINEKNLYEYQLKMLSDNVDKLNEMLENHELQDILDIELVDKYISEFNKYRAKVLSLSSVTEKFLTNLVDYIENILVEHIDYGAITKK